MSESYESLRERLRIAEELFKQESQRANQLKAIADQLEAQLNARQLNEGPDYPIEQEVEIEESDTNSEPSSNASSSEDDVWESGIRIAEEVFGDEFEIIETIVDTERLVVLKCKLKRESIDACLKFKTGITGELEILRKLSSCNHVVELYHSKTIDNSMFFCEEWLISAHNSRHIFQGEPSHFIPQAIEYYLDGMNALLELRHHRVVHCDISPNNFMFSPLSGRWKLIDFEHARCITDETEVVVTHRSMVGTDEFIAPECMVANSDGKYEYSYASDLYSMGKTALEAMLSPAYDLTAMYLSSNTPECRIILQVFDLSFRQLRQNPESRESVEISLKQALETIPMMDKAFSGNVDYYPLINYQQASIKI